MTKTNKKIQDRTTDGQTKHQLDILSSARGGACFQRLLNYANKFQVLHTRMIFTNIYERNIHVNKIMIRFFRF